MLSCGAETRLLNITEPASCTYLMNLEEPSICKPGELEVIDLWPMLTLSRAYARCVCSIPTASRLCTLHMLYSRCCIPPSPCPSRHADVHCLYRRSHRAAQRMSRSVHHVRTTMKTVPIGRSQANVIRIRHICERAVSSHVVVLQQHPLLSLYEQHRG